MKDHQDFSRTVEENMERLRDRAEQTKERLTEGAEEALEKGEEVWRDAKALVKKHPMEAVGVALLIGAAIGVLLSSRRTRD